MDDAEIAAWVAEAVGHSGRDARVEVLGGKQGLIVCRVRLPGAGSFVFKAVRESARRELALTDALARLAPECSPRVLSSTLDAKRDLYLLVMEDLGPRRLTDEPTVERYVEAAKALAALQISSLNDLPLLRELGVPEVGPEQWEEIALRTLEGVQAQKSFTVRSELAPLETVAWSVTDVARDAGCLPSALVHGDIHAGNVVLCEGGSSPVRILDWGSAYIGAAFLGLEELLWPAARHLRSAADLSRVRAAYLRGWEPLLGKPGRLERAVAACQVLVRLQLVDESVRRPEKYDEFAIAATLRKLTDAWRGWKAI